MRKDNRKFVFLTGAGISTVNGLSDYKTIDAEWHFEEPRASLTSIYSFRQEPENFWKGFNYCHPREAIFAAEPTAIHEFLAELENNYSIVLATQNVDSLHSQAGSHGVIELHGNLKELLCYNYMGAFGCGAKFNFIDFRDYEIPKCPECGSVLKPNVSLYGEGVNGMGELREAAFSADVLVALGTSLSVAPANEIFYFGKPYGKSPFKIWVNKNSAPEEFDFDKILTVDFAQNDLSVFLNHLISS